ncbi:spore germination protein [Paenibacillus sp. S3N08]|uniref:Spore germination protein n=2 Tax=Paenibacillus agricola TaxID=2716264 RepID=A0ABX0JAS3_9BACL|nr:spore germination protein [Paenibacillus agricola]
MAAQYEEITRDGAFNLATTNKTKQPFASDLATNRQQMELVFANCHDMVFEIWNYGDELQFEAMTVYCCSLVSMQKHKILEQTLSDLVFHRAGIAEPVTPTFVSSYFGNKGVTKHPFFLICTLEEAYKWLMDGHVVILIDQWDEAIVYRTEGPSKRQVTEPVNEPVVHGPREGTVENLEINIGMLRQRIKNPQFKIEYFYAGEIARNKIVFGYLEGVVNPEVLLEFRSRIAGMEQYEVLETSYLEDWIEDSHYTPFPQVRYTERTDSAAASLMDGKIIVMVENSPMIMICPALFVEFMGTSEDYYVRSVFATFVRLLRIIAFLIALTLPSIYIALSTFHPELIPTVLLLAILDTREGIPFPAFVEALIMEVSFELLREAGIRLPRPVGSAVSIVGALVIGQAAIMAKIASPIMVIVIATTGIASFAIPHYDIAIAIRVLRFPMMIAAGLMGGYGLMAAFLLTLLHMTCLHTLGQPYLSSLAPLKIRDLRDIFIRVPLEYFLRSPRNRRLHRSGGNNRS